MTIAFKRTSSTFAATVAALSLLGPRAQAHFILQSPPAVASQDDFGGPQKAPPCGGENGGGTPSGIVTPYHPGDTVTITIDEVIPHPGHYRIALAPDRSQLPPEPIVTAGTTACGSAPIDPAPVYPVLADGVFKHTTSFSEPQTVQVTLPTNVTCEHCTLQVLEFMSNHPLNNPGGCYYHHCADISILPGTSTDAGPEGTKPVARNGCSSTGGIGMGVAALGLLARLVRRRRSRSPLSGSVGVRPAP